MSAVRRWGAAHPSIMLVIVTLLWGLSFPLMKNWQDAAARNPMGRPLAALTLIAVRMALALAIMAILNPRAYLAPSRREARVGSLLGSVFFLGFAFQVLGLAWTTPALSAFITSLGSAWVPLLAWILFRAAIRRLTLLGMVVGVSGTIVLGMSDLRGIDLGPGEWLTILTSWIFAGQIILLDRLGRTVDSAHLTVPFFGATGLWALALALLFAAGGPGVGAWLTWTLALLREPGILRDIALLSLLSTVLAFHWMNVYQPAVGANRAALIYLLEPVFGTAFSIILGHDPLTVRLLVGGSLILIGNLVVETPSRRRDFRLKDHRGGA